MFVCVHTSHQSFISSNLRSSALNQTDLGWWDEGTSTTEILPRLLHSVTRYLLNRPDIRQCHIPNKTQRLTRNQSPELAPHPIALFPFQLTHFVSFCLASSIFFSWPHPVWNDFFNFDSMKSQEGNFVPQQLHLRLKSFEKSRPSANVSCYVSQSAAVTPALFCRNKDARRLKALQKVPVTQPLWQ